MARILTIETSLGAQADKLSTESKILGKLSPTLIIFGLVAAVVGLTLKMLSITNIDSIYIIGFFLIFIGYGQKVKAGHNTRDAGFMRWGKQGEQLVTEHLQTKLPDDYYIINDCNVTSYSGEKSQIDHLVISKNGLFVVETKNYVGRLSGDAADRYITQIKTFNNKEQEYKITNPVSQNEYHCNVLKNFLHSKKIDITPDYIKSVVIFANDKTEVNISNIDYDNVFVGKIYSAVEYINNYRPDAQQINTNALEDFISLFVSNFKFEG